MSKKSQKHEKTNHYTETKEYIPQHTMPEPLTLQKFADSKVAKLGFFMLARIMLKWGLKIA